MRHQIYVVGPDPTNLAKLRHYARDCEFQELLPLSRVKDQDGFDFSALVADAKLRLETSPVPPDAVIGYWDFPASCLVPLICDERGLPSATLKAAVICEHKYWSRLAQRSAGCDVPAFSWVDPYCEDPLEDIELHEPFWLKPVKSFGSQLAFVVRNPADGPPAIAALRRGLGRLAEPFGAVLTHVELPEDVRRVGAYACITEEHALGRQCTLEGYVRNGKVVSYAVIDSFKDDDGLSFGRYQYPSSLPESAQRRMGAVAATVLRHIDYGNAPFNMEFFYDEARDRITLLEINPRLSQSHAGLFEKVDGRPHLCVLLDLSLGREPDHPHRQGQYACAARFFLRAYEDGVVTRVPSPGALRELERRHPGTDVSLQARPGQRLSSIPNRSSYSYELGTVEVGGHDEQDLMARFVAVRRELEIDLAAVSGALGGRASNPPSYDLLRRRGTPLAPT